MLGFLVVGIMSYRSPCLLVPLLLEDMFLFMFSGDLVGMIHTAPKLFTLFITNRWFVLACSYTVSS